MFVLGKEVIVLQNFMYTTYSFESNCKIPKKITFSNKLTFSPLSQKTFLTRVIIQDFAVEINTSTKQQYLPKSFDRFVVADLQYGLKGVIRGARSFTYFGELSFFWKKGMGRKVRGSVRSITSFVTFTKKPWNFFSNYCKKLTYNFVNMLSIRNDPLTQI